MKEVILTEEKADILKNNYRVTSREEGKVYLTMEQPIYCELLDLNYATLLRLSSNNDVYGDIIYEKVEDHYVVACHTLIDNEMVDNLGLIFTTDTDVLNLYGEKAVDPVAEFFKKGTQEIKDYIEKTDMDLYQELRQLFVNELEVDDLTDGLREEVGEDYIKDNPSSAFSTALDFMSTYDIKDAIKDAIDNL